MGLLLRIRRAWHAFRHPNGQHPLAKIERNSDRFYGAWYQGTAGPRISPIFESDTQIGVAAQMADWHRTETNRS